MKKLILTLIMIFSAMIMYAEDVLQVVPFKAQPGATSADACSFSIEMNNATADIWAFQFDILLPCGMRLDDTDGLEPFELGERCPYTIGRGGVKNWKHTVQYSLLDDGWYRVVVFTTSEDRISGNSGEVLRAYYLMDDNVKEGVYPIYVRNSVLTVSGNSDIKPQDSSSYCTVGGLVLDKGGLADFSMLTGYLPSWVVYSIMDEVDSAEGFTSLDIRNADAFGAEIVLPNVNSLCYVKEGISSENVVAGNIVESGDGFYCEKLNLYDGDGGFYSKCDVVCTSASFDREFKAGFWSTVILPFDIDAEQFDVLSQEGVVVEKLVSYNGNNTLCFEPVEYMQANVPYIIKCENTIAPFKDIEIEAFHSTEKNDTILLDGVSMIGNYGIATLNSDDSRKCYVFDAQNGEFVLVGKNCKVSPFRAYILISTETADCNTIRVSHNGRDVTSVEEYVNGLEISCNVYTTAGVKVREMESTLDSVQELGKGVYIIGNKKVVVK